MTMNSELSGCCSSEMIFDGTGQESQEAMDPAPALQLLAGDLPRAFQILIKDLLEPVCNRFIVENKIELIIDAHGAVIEIRTADRGPNPVDRHALGVHQRGVVLVQLNAPVQQGVKAVTL